jgi:hypothetical protein
MRFVIGITALLVLASIFGSIAGLLFLSERSSNLVHSEQRHSSENKYLWLESYKAKSMGGGLSPVRSVCATE